MARCIEPRSPFMEAHAPVKAPDWMAIRIRRLSTLSVFAKLVLDFEKAIVRMTASSSLNAHSDRLR